MSAHRTLPPINVSGSFSVVTPAPFIVLYIVNILYTIYRTALLGFKLWQNGSAAEWFCGRTILMENGSAAEPFC